jgi:hypothetical protein
MSGDPNDINQGRRNFLTSFLGLTVAFAASPAQALFSPDLMLQRTIETLKSAEFLSLVPKRMPGPSPALNETGAFLFSRIDGRTTVETLARSLTASFETDFNTAVSDLRKLVRDLEILGFIAV